MKRLLQDRRSLLLALGSVALLASLISWGPSEKERMTIAELTTDMKTVCIGRYLIDVPKALEQNNKAVPYSNQFLPAGMDFQEAPRMMLTFDARQKQSLQQFQRDMRIMTDSKRVVTTLRPGDIGYPKYRVVDVSERLTEAAFLFRTTNEGRLPTSSREDVNFELRIWLDGLAVTVSAIAYTPAKQAMTAEHLKKFVQSIKVYDPTKPNQPGFCAGPLLVQGRYSREEYADFFWIDERPDLQLKLELITHGSGRSSTLLERANSPKNLLNVFDIGHSTLRKGKLQVAGMAGQELGVRFSGPDRDGNKRIEHKFMLEVDPPSDPNSQHSQIDLSFDTGRQGFREGTPTKGKELSSSLTDEEALGLWDAIVKSIRPRPGAF
jgi:hypothetical protein